MEQPGQRAGGRGPQVTRLFPTAQGRPLSADDIQKAKMRAQFMRSKYGESYVGSHPHVKTEVPRVLMSATSSSSSSSSKAHVHPKVEEHATSSSSMVTPLAPKPKTPHVQVQPKVDEEKKELVKNEVQEAEEPVWKKCKRLPISWVNPPGIKSTFRFVFFFYIYVFWELAVCRFNRKFVVLLFVHGRKTL